MAKRLLNYINGEWVPSKAAECLPVVNPGTGELIAEVPLSSAAEVAAAAEGADKAFRE